MCAVSSPSPLLDRRPAGGRARKGGKRAELLCAPVDASEQLRKGMPQVLQTALADIGWQDIAAMVNVVGASCEVCPQSAVGTGNSVNPVKVVLQRRSSHAA